MKKNMTPAQKRVAIAKDVISQIEAKQYVPTNMVYVRPAKDLPKKHIGQEMKPLIPRMGKCEVCAIGAAFISSVRLFNNCRVQCDSGVWNEQAVLEQWFDREQCDLMEMAFEASDLKPCYLRAIPEPASRLTTIMRNIIRNRGKFIPTTNDFPKGALCPS